MNESTWRVDEVSIGELSKKLEDLTEMYYAIFAISIVSKFFFKHKVIITSFLIGKPKIQFTDLSDNKTFKD